VHGLGITKMHSSAEYETFPLLCEILQRISHRENPPVFEHVVKLAEPSFDDAAFDGARFEQKIDDYCCALGVESLTDIQWMWRKNLDDDFNRISGFERAIPAMSKAFTALKSTGTFTRLLCFPYSTNFAQAAIGLDVVDGLTVYRNGAEIEYDQLIADCGKMGKSVLVIRPLNAGKDLRVAETSAAQHVRAALDMPAIEAGIISSNSLDHIRELLA
jgi:hypothetical protein